MSIIPIGESTAHVVIKLALVVAVLVTSMLASRLFNRLKLSRALSKYPIANEKWDAAAKQELQFSAHAVLRKGAAMANGGPFRINDMTTSRLILPHKYTDDIKNHKSLDFKKYFAKEFFSTYPGFEPFGVTADNTILQDAIRIQFPQVLDWKETALTPAALKSVSRLTSLIFLGESFMNNEDWQRVSVMYTLDAFLAARALSAWPAIARPFVHWFLPECRKVRAEVKIARNLITPEVTRRRAELALNGGKPRRQVMDSVDWFTQSAKGKPFDFASAELSLAMASINSTSSTLAFTMFDLLENPEYMDLLREEIKSVFEEGRKWDKSSLNKLRLMDSVLKESMRLHPHTIVNMPRQATDDLKISDNITIPKSTFIGIGPEPMSDPTIYPNPEKFDGHRFLRLRNAPGNESKYQLVTTSPEFNVFGHGGYACPGRFFASNHMKLSLSHMLLHYEWKLPEGHEKVQHMIHGLIRKPNMTQKILFRSREPEVVFDYSE